jgi:tRNA splicing ligase
VSLNLSLLEQLVRDKYISVQKHPEVELYIYNYTPLTQFDRNWNEITLACRGLILDDKYRIVARPFPKFFNLEEHQLQEIPQEPFDVYSKLDGSLGILYWLKGKPRIATRGSFSSEQALVGTQILQQKYQCICDIATLKQLEQKNREGFVIRFASGFRVKVKFEEYVRLHRIVTQISNKTIWKLLVDRQSLETILDDVPDEWYDWVKSISREVDSRSPRASLLEIVSAIRIVKTREISSKINLFKVFSKKSEKRYV